MAINETLEAGRRVDTDVSFIPTGMKVGYSVGDFGANLVIQTVGIYLMFFFTDVFGIVPALAGAIFLYSKMWEAVSNPLMGVISDHTDTRWGKKRPYLLFGAVPLGAAVFLLFFSPAVAPGLRFTWGLVTFLIFCTTLTVVNVPYLAITPTLTLDFNERSVVTGIRAAFAIGGALVAAGATLPLVGLFGGGDPGQGFRMVGLTYGIVV
jgi:GPH family glycoside/pentoside/hexuronide:cation symporter